MDKLKAAIYCSTPFTKNVWRAQDIIFEQKERLAIYAAAHQIYIESDYEDIGYMREDYDRPALQHMLLSARGGEFDIILVWNAEAFLYTDITENPAFPLRMRSASEDREWVVDCDKLFLSERFPQPIIVPDKRSIAFYWREASFKN